MVETISLVGAKNMNLKDDLQKLLQKLRYSIKSEFNRRFLGTKGKILEMGDRLRDARQQL